METNETPAEEAGEAKLPEEAERPEATKPDHRWLRVFKPLIFLLKWIGRIFLFVGRILVRSKVFWTVCTLGIAWGLWKLLDKIYGPKYVAR